MTMFGAFRGKLFSAGYWSNVAASWSSYLIQLNKDDTPMFEVDEDGNVEAAGLVAAPQLDLGTDSTIDATSVNSAVLGGDHNVLHAAPGCTVAGDKNEIDHAEFSAISSGIECGIIGTAEAPCRQCFIGTGEGYASIGAGSTICAILAGLNSTIGSGCTGCTIAGGVQNHIGDGLFDAIIGGGGGAVILGGIGNEVNADGGMILGGTSNAVAGKCGCAYGVGAQAGHDYSHVWCDGTGIGDDYLASTAPNQWIARATGGFRWNNNVTGDEYATLAAGELTVSDKVITPALKVTGGTPGAGKVLTSDANGDATWATPKRTITITITPYGTIGTGGYYWGGKQELGAVNGFIMPTGFQPTRIELIARNDGANGVDQQLSAAIGQISDAAYTEYDTLTLASTALYEYKAERRTYDGVSGPGPWLTGRRLAVFIRRVAGNAAWEQVSLVITAEVDA